MIAGSKRNIKKLTKLNRFEDERIDKEFDLLVRSVNEAFDIINERNKENVGNTDTKNKSMPEGSINVDTGNETPINATMQKSNTKFDIPLSKNGEGFSIGYNIVTVTAASYTVTTKNRTVLVVAVPGSTMTLPAASTAKNLEFIIKKIDTSINNITVTPQAGELIDNAASYTITGAYTFIRLQSDGSNWWTV